MGAISFEQEVTARSAKEAFDILIEKADYRDGRDMYNGSINTCSMGVCKKKFDKYLKSNEDKARDFIAKNNCGEKWIANYIDLGVIKYESVTYKRIHRDGASKNYRMKYQVFEYDDMSRDYDIPMEDLYYDTKQEADKKALQLAIKNYKL